MIEKVYVVEWYRAYSEYGFCFISKDESKAERVKEVKEDKYAEDVYGTTFEVNEYNLDEVYDIWT